MPKLTQVLAAALSVALSVSLLGTNESVQSYDALMALSAQGRRAALAAMDPDAKFAMYRTHTQRWLDRNRHRMSGNQIALVSEVRDLLTPDQSHSPRMIELTQRMRCELWHSDVLALALPQEIYRHHRGQATSVTGFVAV